MSPNDPASVNDSTGSKGSRAWLREIRESLAGKQHDYTSGSLRRAIVLLAIPMVIEMSMESIFAVVDIYFVSSLGKEAVATVGLTESMLTIVYALGIGLAMGTTAMVARRVGEKNIDSAVRAATQSILVGATFGLVLGVGCAIFSKDLLHLMGASPDVIEVGTTYTALLLGTNVVIMLLFLNNAIFRGAGDAALSMKVLLLANGINIVLDPCLIRGWGPFPELGVTGAAVATLIGRGCGVVFQFWLLRRGHGRIALRGPACRFHVPAMRELLRISAGGVIQFLIATSSWIFLMRIVAGYYEADEMRESAVAGYTIAIRIIVFALLPSWGLSNAAATLVGQNLGAGRPDRAERAVWLTGWFNAIFLGIVTVVFVFFDAELVSFFTNELDTIDHGADALRIISYGYICYSWGMVMTQAFNGAGDTRTPTRINFVCFWMIQLPLAWTLTNWIDVGPRGVYWSVAISETILAAGVIVIFRKGQWKDSQIGGD